MSYFMYASQFEVKLEYGDLWGEEIGALKAMAADTSLPPSQRIAAVLLIQDWYIKNDDWVDGMEWAQNNWKEIQHPDVRKALSDMIDDFWDIVAEIKYQEHQDYLRTMPFPLNLGN